MLMGFVCGIPTSDQFYLILYVTQVDTYPLHKSQCCNISS